jgi:Spondin_N
MKSQSAFEKLAGVLLIVIASLLASPVSARNSGATYTVTFNAMWTKETHPNASFPDHPFFLRLIGTAHPTNVQYWKLGELASPGVKLVAEEGGTVLLANAVVSPNSVSAMATRVGQGGVP